MTVINAIEDVKKLLEMRVAPNITLLVPSGIDGKEYTEKYANPKVFELFEPENGRLPEGVEYTTPNIVVQFSQGRENIATNKKGIDIVLAFSTWRPGDYRTLNNLEYKGIEVGTEGAKIEFAGEIEKTLIRNENGWKDVYNLMELSKKEIISAGKIGNFVLDAATDIKYGPYTKDGALVDFYPYYHLWMSFTLISIPTPMMRDEIEELL